MSRHWFVLMMVVTVLLALGLVVKFFVVVVPEAATGVRLKMGVPTTEQISHGLYWHVPYLYEVHVFSGSIHISKLSLAAVAGACAKTPQTLGEPLRVLWRVVDGRVFYGLNRTNVQSSDAALGEAAIELALCNVGAVPSMHTPGQTSGALSQPILDRHSLRSFLNQQLLPQAGIEILAVEDDS